MATMMFPIAVVTGYIGERMVSNPDMTVVGNIAPATSTVRNIVHYSRSPIATTVNINPLTIII